MTNPDSCGLTRAQLTRYLEQALDGDATSAVKVAMITHLFPEMATDQGLHSQYDFYLAQAAKSDDPELLVCIGEALVGGKLLARNERLGARFFHLANQNSPFMGAFIIGRIEGFIGQRVGRRMLKKAAMAGHIPSAIARGRLFMKRLGVFKIFYFPVYVVANHFRISRALKGGKDLYSRFWRYKDVFVPKNDVIAKALPKDRADPFYDIKELIEMAQ